MTSITNLLAAGLNTAYPTTNRSNSGTSPQDANTSSATSQSDDSSDTQNDLTPDSNQISSDLDSVASNTPTSTPPPPPPDTSTTDSSTDSTDNGPFTSSVANADYRTLVKDLDSGNTAAVQRDESKLQLDLDATATQGGYHHISADTTGNHVYVTV